MSKKDTQNVEMKPLILSEYPDEIKRFIEPLNDQKLEEISLNINEILSKQNIKDFGMVVIKTMELVEEIRELNGKQKYEIASRCIVKIIQNNNKLSLDTKIDYIISIPGLIESVIQLTKGETLNKIDENTHITEIKYITKRATDKILDFIAYKKYDTESILKNIFLIATQTMYVVGSFSSLSGEEKKEIVIDIITNIIHNYRDKTTNKKIPKHFIDMALKSLPTIIDTLVDVSNNKFNINNIKTILSFMKSCCACG